MKIDQLKSQYLSAKAQIVLMDEQCTLIDTCRTLFEVDTSSDIALQNAFPILESLVPIFEQLPEKEELYLPRVEFNIGDKEYIADFVFFRNPFEFPQIVWIIQDLSQQYIHFSEIQKERNELNIKNSRLEFQQRVLAMQGELQYRQKIAEQMLQFSLATRNENFDFTNTLWTLVHSVVQPDDNHVPLKLVIDKSIPNMLYGNYYNLCQILNNLISIILRKTNQKEIQLTIEKTNQIENTIHIKFNLLNVDMYLPNYEKYIAKKGDNVSKQPLLYGNNVLLYIAQSLLFDHGSRFESTSYAANAKLYTYSFEMGFTLSAD